MFVVTAVTAVYFNVFVLVVQAFLKIGPLHALAPTASETPFAATQAVVLVPFAVTGYQAFRRSRRIIA